VIAVKTFHLFVIQNFETRFQRAIAFYIFSGTRGQQITMAVHVTLGYLHVMIRTYT